MTLDLSKIDLAAVEALAALKTERDQLSDRLKAMTARRDQVSAEVFTRVHDDYRRRLDELFAQAAPLKQKAGEVYRALRAELNRLDQDFSAARLDREEIDFRHSLGEFDASDLQQRLAAVDQRLAAHGQAREQASALKDRFLAVVESEDDLENSDEDTARMSAIRPAIAIPSEPTPTVVAGPLKPAAPIENNATVVSSSLQPPAAVPAAIPPPAPAAAVAAPVAPAAARGAVSRSSRNPDATVVFRQGRLEPRNAEAGSVVQTLGLRPISIGSDGACDLHLTAAGIAKKHVEIMMTRSGFSVRDVSASGSTKVNGEAVQERVLAEGDTLSVGPAQFNFRLL